ncbi:MAG: serine hydrolase domain-containing protein [Bacteroidota bacterium]
MKTKRYYSLILAGIILAGIQACKEDTIVPSAVCTISYEDSSSTHPKGAFYQSILDKYTGKGLPGIVLLIQDESGMWIGSSGKADIENNIDMMPCTVSKVASITKLFIGTLTMILEEEGVLDLDDKISKYLDDKIIKKIKNADETTIRQLMNHTSGIYDHVSDQGFYLKLLNNPNKNWEPEELLEFVYGKPAYFETGTGVHYSNTNFLLLSMVIDQATGSSHADILRSKIIQPLGLMNTYYHWHEKLPDITAQGYYDLYNNGTILNMSNYHTGSGNGYGGIYSTVRDMQIFLKALLIDKILLSDSSLNVMMTFTNLEEVDEQGEGRNLGLGMFKQHFLYMAPDEFGYGHGGRDLQYSADLYWFPKNNVIMAYLVNYGTNGTTALRDVFYDFRLEVVDGIFNDN